MEDSLDGKVALVTGASSGIGKVLSLALVKQGCNVIAAARREHLLQALLDEVKTVRSNFVDGSTGIKPGKLVIAVIDVSADYATISAAVEKAWNIFGAINVLLNNAGVRGTVKSPLDLDENEWNTVYNTNLRGGWLMSKAVGRKMRSANMKGSIINISSISGLERSILPGAVAYTSSKAAMHQLTRVLALELGQYGIRVNAIAPGLFRSEITSDLFERDWLGKVAQKIVPVGVWPSTDPDLTSIVLLLASDLTSYVTGNIFIVDGGQSLPAIPVWSSL